MNRRIRRSSTNKVPNSYLRFLKPGALAQLRDSRISARTHLVTSQAQIPSYRTPSPFSSPVRSANAGQEQIGATDVIPCLTGRIHGPRWLQRKRVVAAKSVLFLGSIPVSESPDPIVDVLSNDGLVAH